MAKSFINPYAFVSFNKKNIVGKTLDDLQKDNTYTGCFEYTIELKTPLIIPNTSSNEFNLDSSVSNSYGIYSYENLTNKKQQDAKYQPVIPGSEIKGCIRNVYEALTNSCYNFDKKKDMYFSERLDPKKSYKPGILVNVSNGEWKLFAADKYNDAYDDKSNNNYTINIDDEVYDMFEKVYVNVNDTEFDDISKISNGAEEGYLTIGNKGPKKNSCISVFVKKGKPLLTITNNDDNYKRLIASIESFVDKNLNCTYQRYLDALKENKTITIYYDYVNGNFRFSPAQIGRVLFNTSLRELVGDSSNCTDSLCPACLLFGNINDQNSVSGRVRFSDATITNYDYSKAKSIDLISGSPKYSNKYFYAKLGSTKDDWDNVVSIKGRKFYWHHIPNIENIRRKVEKNTNFKLKSRYYYIDNNLNGNKFIGKIFFNDLTEEEVLNLYKAISLVDDNHCHKLGHGKPFGFGSCNFTVTNLNSCELAIDEIKNNVAWTNQTTDLELEYILDFTALDKYTKNKILVNYPFNNDPINDDGFKWFASNKKEKYPQQLPPLISGTARKSPILNGYDTNKNANINHSNKLGRR